MKKGDDIRKTVVRQIRQPDKQTLTIIEWQHFGKQNCNWLGVKKKLLPQQNMILLHCVL